MGRLPKVSIVIPLHGETPFLQATLQSIFDQSMPEWELILVLDRPSATTEKICFIASSSDKRIQVAFSPSPGISSALNKGLSICRTPYLARLDGDDLMAPSRLEKQLTQLEINTNLVCLGSQVLLVDSNGSETGLSSYPTTPWQVSCVLPAMNCLAHPSVMLRTDAVQKVGGYESALNGVEDYNLWLKLIEIGEIANLSEPLTYYRQHENQISRKNVEVNQSLERLARLDALGVIEKYRHKSWSAELANFNVEQTNKLLLDFENLLGNRSRKQQKSYQYLAKYSATHSLMKFAFLSKALLYAPIRSLLVMATLLLRSKLPDNRKNH